MTLHVALVTDHAYLPWCAAAVRSCLDHHPPDGLHVHVVHDGSVTLEDGARLRAMAGSRPLTLHPTGLEAVEHLPALDRFGHIVWLRFLLPELLPDVDRVLYLDADTLVTAPLAELAVLDLEGAPLGAVRNVTLPEEHPRLEALGLDPQDLFNSGVLLLDLAQLREAGFTERAAAMAAELGPQVRWPDQDVLNLLFAGRWHRLHPRFNALNSLFEWALLAERTHGVAARRAALNDPAVVHFEGPYLCKPWHALAHHPWRGAYLEVLARTPWADVGLEDDTAITRTIRRLPRGWQLPIYEQVVRRRAGAGLSLREALRRRRAGSHAT